MNGPLAQVVALTCHGNAFLKGNRIDEFLSSNSTCTFCGGVRFVTINRSLFGKLYEKEVSKSPNDWFRFIKGRIARGIRLTWTPSNSLHTSDRMSAGFVGGGGSWMLEVLLPDGHSELWSPKWEVGDQNAPEQRIWRVTYGRVAEARSVEGSRPNLQSAISRLTQSLLDIHTFSVKHDCGVFTQLFADALKILRAEGEGLLGYHKDLAPPGYLSSQEQAILHSCQKAWVFGGMGSWNDMGFAGADQIEYDQVSEELFQAIIEAITAGVNSSYYRTK